MSRIPTLLQIVWMGLLISLFPHAGQAGVIEARLPTGKVATADFHAGNDGLPAVLILHGFLQTRTFPTIASTYEALSTAGYTVVAPTLSLGISRRNKSLSCEAAHLHSLEDDTEEVAFWVRWLEQKRHQSIVLVGHSFGNVQLLSYLRRSPSPAVTQAILISLVDVEAKQGPQARDRLAQALRDRIVHGNNALLGAEFGNCRKYVSPPAALLSYLNVSRNSILDALARSPVPVEVIMGGKDDRMGADWVEKLVARGIKVRVIPGASHFFDDQYEFDLQEAVLRALSRRPPGR